MEHRAERLAVVDRVEELLSHLYGEPRLCIASEACPGCVVLRFPASLAVASFQPAGQGAVCCLWAASSIIRIGKVADLAHLLQTTLGKLSTDISGVLFAFPRHDQAKKFTRARAWGVGNVVITVEHGTDLRGSCVRAACVLVCTARRA
jgi:hypothetical protein